MNNIVLDSYSFDFGYADHLYFHPVINKSKMPPFLVDTGFSLGIVLPSNYIKDFGFVGGYMTKLVLATEKYVSGMVFLVNITIDEKVIDQKVSFLFMNSISEPLIGVEFLRIFNDLSISWKNKTVLVTL